MFGGWGWAELAVQRGWLFSSWLFREEAVQVAVRGAPVAQKVEHSVLFFLSIFLSFFGCEGRCACSSGAVCVMVSWRRPRSPFP
jgi:hypothetical protein